jgi:hypothetical protein
MAHHIMNENELADLFTQYSNYIALFKNPQLDQMINELGERLLISTYSTKIEDGYCGPGSILRFALDSFRFANKMAKNLDTEILEMSRKSLAIITLLFPLGRLGDLENDQFIEQKSEWHRNKLGQLYDYNPRCPKMSVPHRTLFLLQHFGVQLTTEEMIGILCSTGFHLEENRFYLHNVSQMVQLCIHAIDMAYEREKYLSRQLLES